MDKQDLQKRIEICKSSIRSCENTIADYTKKITYLEEQLKKSDWLNEGDVCFMVDATGEIEEDYYVKSDYTFFKYRKTAEQASKLLKLNNTVLQWQEKNQEEVAVGDWYIAKKSGRLVVECFVLILSEYAMIPFILAEKAEQCLTDLKPIFDEFYGVKDETK